MMLDITPMLERAISDHMSAPVDLTDAGIDISLRYAFENVQDSSIAIATVFNARIGPNARQRARRAFLAAGLDDLSAARAARAMCDFAEGL